MLSRTQTIASLQSEGLYMPSRPTKEHLDQLRHKQKLAMLEKYIAFFDQRLRLQSLVMESIVDKLRTLSDWKMYLPDKFQIDQQFYYDLLNTSASYGLEYAMQELDAHIKDLTLGLKTFLKNSANDDSEIVSKLDDVTKMRYSHVKRMSRKDGFDLEKKHRSLIPCIDVAAEKSELVDRIICSEITSDEEMIKILVKHFSINDFDHL